MNCTPALSLFGVYLFRFKVYLLQFVVIKDQQVRLEKLRDVIWLLPDENRQFLEYILTFLAEVAAFSEQNKMTLTNLSTIFGPLLLRYDQTYDEMLTESATVCNIIAKLVEERYELFTH